MAKLDAVESLVWHDCVVLEMSFDVQLRTINLLVEPSGDMLKFVEDVSPSATRLRVSFRGIKNVRTSGGFVFFKKQDSADGEILRATFIKNDETKTSDFSIVVSKRRHGFVEESYGGIVFCYTHAVYNASL